MYINERYIQLYSYSSQPNIFDDCLDMHMVTKNLEDILERSKSQEVAALKSGYDFYKFIDPRTPQLKYHLA